MFDFDIDTSWDAAFEVIRQRTGTSVTRHAAERYKRAWAEAKKPFVEYLGPTGRLVVQYNVGDLIRDSDDNQTWRSVLLNLGISDPHSGWLGLLLCDIIDTITLSELLENRLVKQRQDPLHPSKKCPPGMKLTTYFGRYAAAKTTFTTTDISVEGRVVAAVVDMVVDLAVVGVRTLRVYDSNWLYKTVPSSKQAVITKQLESAMAAYAAEWLGNVVSSMCLTGEFSLVLSVNPLDVLLASEHTTGWKSCISLGACHNTAPLAYLTDPHTAIVYAYKNTADYCGLPLPRKFWRQWVYFDLQRGGALHQRQYPSQLLVVSRAARRLSTRVLAGVLGVSERRRITRSPAGDLIVPSEWVYVDPTEHRVVMLDVAGASPNRALSVAPGSTFYCLLCGEEPSNSSVSRLICDKCRAVSPTAGMSLVS